MQYAIDVLPTLLVKLLVGLLVGLQFPGMFVFDLQFV